MSQRVECEVEEIEKLNESTGRTQPGVSVSCGRCGLCTESFGTSEKSIKRCLVLLREECPEQEGNFYVVEED